MPAAKESKSVKTKKPAVSTKKPVKKSTTSKKTTTSRSAKVESKPVETVMSESFTPSSVSARPAFKVKKSYVILLVVLLALVIFLYFGRSWLVAAVVNGQPISRMSVIHQAEQQSGKQSLNNLIRNVLIEQEARKEHVTVSDKEINDQVNQVTSNLKKQGQNIDDVLAMQGMTKSDLRNLIRLDQLVGKMVGNSIKISDKDVNDYIAKNKDLLPKDQTDAQLKATVRDRLKQQELNTKVQTWLADLQSKANILYFVNY
jgi:hypothetical protein